MTINEKAAYLKGLVEGQGLDPETGEGKLWNVLSELVGDLARALGNLQEEHEDLADSVAEIAVNVDYLEELFSDDFDDDDFDDDEDDGVYPFARDPIPFPGLDGGDDEDEDDDDEDDDEDFEEEYYYEVECPSCGETLELSEEDLEQGFVICPGCGARLKFADDVEIVDGDSDEDAEYDAGDAPEADEADFGFTEVGGDASPSGGGGVDVPPVF